MYNTQLTERQRDLISEMKRANPHIEDRTELKHNPLKLEGETEAQYVERLTADYKARMSDSTPPALLNRAVTFIQAMASKVFEKPVNEEMQSKRLNVCYSCEHFQVAFNAPEQIGHCGACGCGKSKLSSLAEKSKIQVSTCPKNLWDLPSV